MFDVVECYTGGIHQPEPGSDVDPALVHNNAQKAPVNGDVVSHADGRHSQATPEFIIQNAYREAERIVLEAREQAEQDGENIINEAQTRADEIAVQSVSNAAVEMGLDLWSSRYVLTDVVEKALTSMIGHVGENEACYRAVEVAIRQTCEDKSVTVLAENRTADRLRLVSLSNRDNPKSFVFDITTDDTLAPGRCVIKAGNKLLDVSIEAQISAIKKACDQQVAAIRDIAGDGDVTVSDEGDMS